MSITSVEQEQVQLMKRHMQQTIEFMNYENAEVSFNVLTSQYDVLKQLYEIESMKKGITADVDTVDDLEGNQDTSDESTGIEEEVEVDEEVNKAVPQRKMYRVERKLKGAYVPEIEGFIPEIIRRNNGIEHGDLVYATPIESQRVGQKRFEYELARKMNEEAQYGLIEYLGCPIEKDGSMLVVKRSILTGESIRLNEIPFTILISDDDIMQLSLQEDDIIDVAFYENNPNTATVVWKHDVSNIALAEDIEPQRKKKVVSKSEFEDNHITDLEQVFEGQVVCIVGDKPNKSAYKTLIEERGGEHLHVEPKWKVDRIDNAIKKSDVVIGLYDMCSHISLETAKASCKAYDVPYAMISGRGKSKVIQTAIELINDTVSS